jgi:hypothetical protein
VTELDLQRAVGDPPAVAATDPAESTVQEEHVEAAENYLNLVRHCGTDRMADSEVR